MSPRHQPQLRTAQRTRVEPQLRMTRVQLQLRGTRVALQLRDRVDHDLDRVDHDLDRADHVLQPQLPTQRTDPKTLEACM